MLSNILALIGLALAIVALTGVIKAVVRILLTIILVPFLVLCAYVRRRTAGPTQAALIPPDLARVLNLTLAIALLWIFEAAVRIVLWKPWRLKSV